MDVSIQCKGSNYFRFDKSSPVNHFLVTSSTASSNIFPILIPSFFKAFIFVLVFGCIVTETCTFLSLGFSRFGLPAPSLFPPLAILEINKITWCYISIFFHIFQSIVHWQNLILIHELQFITGTD